MDPLLIKPMPKTRFIAESMFFYQKSPFLGYAMLVNDETRECVRTFTTTWNTEPLPKETQSVIFLCQISLRWSAGSAKRRLPTKRGPKNTRPTNRTTPNREYNEGIVFRFRPFGMRPLTRTGDGQTFAFSGPLPSSARQSDSHAVATLQPHQNDRQLMNSKRLGKNDGKMTQIRSLACINASNGHHFGRGSRHFANQNGHQITWQSVMKPRKEKPNKQSPFNSVNWIIYSPR